MSSPPMAMGRRSVKFVRGDLQILLSLAVGCQIIESIFCRAKGPDLARAYEKSISPAEILGQLRFDFESGRKTEARYGRMAWQKPVDLPDAGLLSHQLTYNTVQR
ncbi:hypothetical protein FIBSPDRAFT_371049 [Athelia psychrophila]|uniref:Uncharacterized protein n=1 Tax=Athelia psychrophila TaxID=1759441 RepID=A0A167VF10_9AGAM|nr:hypothetical protein FIBSPDRAFT_371049 [Fibularhizoctonia sp. CBS 109695]